MARIRPVTRLRAGNSSVSGSVYAEHTGSGLLVPASSTLAGTGNVSSQGGGSSLPSGNIANDGFESGDMSYTENGFSWGGMRNTSVQSTRPKDGTYSLRFRFNDPGAGSSFAEQRLNCDNESALWWAYDLWVPADYYHTTNEGGSSNNKGFMYLWSGDYGSPSGPGMGPNMWPNGDGTSWMTFFWWTGSNPAGGHINGNHVGWGGHFQAIEAADYGKWITLIGYYQYASAANNDGIARIWKIRDGVQSLILEITNGPWYEPGQPGFDQGYILGANNADFEQQTDFYLDNFKLSTASLLPGS